MKYDEAVIARFARQLYRRARTVEIGYTLLGALACGAAVAFVARAVEGDVVTATLVATGAGGLVGWLMAQASAFALRAHAQTALCQVQVERNTRSTAFHAATMAAGSILPTEDPRLDGPRAVSDAACSVVFSASNAAGEPHEA